MLGFRHSRRVGETQIRGRLRVRADCSAVAAVESDSGANEIPARDMNGLIGHDVLHDRYKRVKLTRTERGATFVRSGRACAMCAATTNGSVFLGALSATGSPAHQPWRVLPRRRRSRRAFRRGDWDGRRASGCSTRRPPMGRPGGLAWRSQARRRRGVQTKRTGLRIGNEGPFARTFRGEVSF